VKEKINKLLKAEIDAYMSNNPGIRNGDDLFHLIWDII
jgi:hypothetical protein